MRRALAPLLAAFGFVAGLFPVFDGDIFWHLAAGRGIVAAGALPRFDPFRFGAGELPWIDHEWLFQLIVYLVEIAVGLEGLIVVRAAALGGLALLLFGAARRGGLGEGPAALVTLGAVLGVRPRFLDRPEIATLFLMLLFLESLQAIEDQRLARATGAGTGARRLPRDGGRAPAPTGGGAWLWLAPLLLVVLWVNLHGEAILAPLLAAGFLLGAAIDCRNGDRGEGRSGETEWRRRLSGAAGLVAAVSVALLVNPYGWRLIEVPLGIRAALDDLAAANPEWLSAAAAPQPYLFGGLAVVAALALLARSASGRWQALAWAAPACGTAIIALSAVRHQALFFVAALPFAARNLAVLAAAAAAPGRSRRRGATWTAAGAIVVAAFWCLAPPASGPFRPRHGGLRFGLGLAEGRFPVRLAGILAGHPEIGPLYNEFAHGGYLLWRLYPPRRVFIDGRMELEPTLPGVLARARRDAGSWAALLADRGATGALVRYESRQVPVLEANGLGGFRLVERRTANAFLFPPERWDLVDWDDEAMLFLQRGRHAWPGAPYRAVQPEDGAWTLARAASDAEFRVRASAEVARKLREQPDCRRARRLGDQLRSLDR